MLSFLNPVLLLGILGASIPIIIHLINKRKSVSHKFAAIDFLLETNKRISIKFKVRQLILLILRASLLMFLALSLAKPFIKNSGGGAEEKNIPTSNVIIIDDSLSMQYSDRQDPFFSSAKTAAKQIVDTFKKDDEAAVIVCSSSKPLVLPELEDDKKHLFDTIDQFHPGFTATHIMSALDTAVEILASAKTSIRRIFLLTDMTRNGWDPHWFKGGHEKLQRHVTRFHILDVSEGKILKNIAITHAELQLNLMERNAEIRIKATISNFSPVPVKDLPAHIYIHGKKSAQGFFNIETNASETKEFFITAEKGKDIYGWVEIPGDNLLADNKRYFTINASQPIEALLIDGDPKTNIYESETFYLEKALNPGREHLSLIKPSLCAIHEVNNMTFADFNIIFLCNVETLPPEKIQELEKFVQKGGTVIFTLGNNVDADYYNTAFGALLPHRLHTIRTFSSNSPLSEEQPLHLKTTEPIHPVMSILSESQISMLSLVKFYRIFYIDPTPLGSCKTILSFSNDTPALIERQVGQGKSVLFAASIDRDWTDFPVKPFFLPVMQQLCRYVTGSIPEEISKEILVKDAWQYPCAFDTNVIEITDPEGTQTVVQPQFADNEKYFKYEETKMPGIYAVAVDGKLHPQFPAYFSVNVDPAESNLKKINKSEITALMGGTKLSITTSHTGEESSVLLGEAKKTLWGQLLFLTLCILFLESFISRK